jgi:hypothetical protein
MPLASEEPEMPTATVGVPHVAPPSTLFAVATPQLHSLLGDVVLFAFQKICTAPSCVVPNATVHGAELIPVTVALLADTASFIGPHVAPPSRELRVTKFVGDSSLLLPMRCDTVRRSDDGATAMREGIL